MKEKQSRSSQALSEIIKAKLINGETPVGSLLPSIRTLTTTYQYSLKTVHRALHILVDEGYLAAEPYRGYRVMPLVNDPLANSPLVFIMGADRKEGHLSYSYQSLFEEIKRAAAKLGWSILIISSDGNSIDNILKQIHQSRAFGVILEGCGDDLTLKIKETKIPILSIDSWSAKTNIDSVTQDGQMGSIQATEYLLNKGYTDIVWFGSSLKDSHRDDRLSGFMTSMYNANINLKTENIITCQTQEINKLAKQILKKRPQAIIALWINYGVGIIEAAQELGLKVGKDFELITWCMEEAVKYESKVSLKNLSMPIITWSGKSLAKSALSLLASKRIQADLSPIRIKIPTILSKLDSTGKLKEIR